MNEQHPERCLCYTCRLVKEEGLSYQQAFLRLQQQEEQALAKYGWYMQSQQVK